LYNAGFDRMSRVMREYIICTHFTSSNKKGERERNKGKRQKEKEGERETIEKRR